MIKKIIVINKKKLCVYTAAVEELVNKNKSIKIKIKTRVLRIHWKKFM